MKSEVRSYRIRSSVIVGVIGGLASIPLVGVLATMFGARVEAAAVWALVVAPIYIGALASAWWLALSPWSTGELLRSIVLGAATGVLAFFSFALTVALLPGDIGREGFYVVGIMGFLLFGWIPVIAGAFAGWATQTPGVPLSKRAQ